ncbi:MAG TPA: DUF1415 domain-containing protein [Flavisolibacter sp.]|nr:DUF1415 domain-containing protein [Flavisolibacter sp.]
MKKDEDFITETKNWIQNVVIGCNFCPFAAKEFNQDHIHYEVHYSADRRKVLELLSFEFNRLDQTDEIETTIIILPESFKDFKSYLELVDLSNSFLKDIGKEGIYQFASFHPDYLFRGSSKNDPSNYTNRSVYPLIQILRESSITNALEHFNKPESIPERNISFAHKKGLNYMQVLLQSCYLRE